MSCETCALGLEIGSVYNIVNKGDVLELTCLDCGANNSLPRTPSRYVGKSIGGGQPQHIFDLVNPVTCVSGCRIGQAIVPCGGGWTHGLFSGQEVLKPEPIIIGAEPDAEKVA